MFKKTVSEFSTAVVWKKGRIVELLTPGQYPYFLFSSTKIDTYDMRAMPFKVSGQEIILSDRTSLKINIAGTYKLVDPIKRIKAVPDNQLEDYINQQVQLILRDVVSANDLDTLFEKKSDLSKEFMVKLADELATIGYEVLTAAIKDVILPADLRAAYVESAAAKTRSKAQLEYARGQSAALRNLANSASLIEQHPQLLQLMSIQKADKASQSQVNLHFDK